MNIMDLNETKYRQDNAELGSNIIVKQEAPEVVDSLLELLEYKVPTTIQSDCKLESPSSNALKPEIISNGPFHVKSESLAWETHANIYIKQELLHEELDIKIEDEAFLGGNQPCNSSGIKPFHCNICGYSCSNKSKFKIHLRTHTGEKPFKCDVCECSFAVNSSLNRHLKTHTGEKPFKCNICDFNFRQKCDLKIHLRTHTGEFFKCNFCSYSCIKNSNLQQHLRTHTGEKPFKCNVCEYSSSHKNRLKKHLKSHT